MDTRAQLKSSISNLNIEKADDLFKIFNEIAKKLDETGYAITAEQLGIPELLKNIKNPQQYANDQAKAKLMSQMNEVALNVFATLRNNDQIDEALQIRASLTKQFNCVFPRTKDDMNAIAAEFLKNSPDNSPKASPKWEKKSPSSASITSNNLLSQREQQSRGRGRTNAISENKLPLNTVLNLLSMENNAKNLSDLFQNASEKMSEHHIDPSYLGMPELLTAINNPKSYSSDLEKIQLMHSISTMFATVLSTLRHQDDQMDTITSLKTGIVQSLKCDVFQRRDELLNKEAELKNANVAPTPRKPSNG